MEMREFIEMGEKEAGKQIDLAKYLEVPSSTLRLAKYGKRGLPDALCIKLADYIKVDRLEVIAASNLIYEKDEKRRKILEGCFKTAKTASIALAIGVATIGSPSTLNAEIANNKSMYIM
jgi:hypothetical protein